MKLENAFEVPADPDVVWKFLLDVEGVVPCMPGAELTEVVDESTWRGGVRIKIGPVSMRYQGQVVIEERDDVARRVVLRAEGKDAGGKGGAAAAVVSTVEALEGGGTRVTMVNDLTLSGPAAQFGRGMVSDVSRRLTDQFADCLRLRIQSSGAGEEPTAEAAEVAGVRLGLWSVWRAVVRAVRRLLGRGERG